MFFGGVHLFERLMLTLFLLVSGVALAIRGRFDDHRKAIYIVLAGLVLAAVPLIPVSGDWRMQETPLQ